MPPSAESGARREAGPRPPVDGHRAARWVALGVVAVAAIAAAVLAARTIDGLGTGPPDPPAAGRTSDPASCQELTLDPMPLELHETGRRRLLPDRDVSPLRVDLGGIGERRLTILSGQAEELAGDPLGHRLIAGRAARFVRSAAGTLALVATADGDPGCGGFTVVASGYRLDEFELMLGRFVLLPTP